MPFMSAEKTLAVILRAVDYSETSCVLTLLTQSHGKIAALAKGARRPKGPFFGAIDVLSLSQVVFLPRRAAHLDLLTEAKLQRRFRPCQWSLARLYAGYYVAELVLELTEPHESLPLLFAQVVQTLGDLQTPETDFAYQPVSAIVLRFELRCLAALGHGLGLTHCCVCDREIELEAATQDQTRLHFSLLETSLICEACFRGKRQLIEVTSAEVRLLQDFALEDEHQWRSQSRCAISASLRNLMDAHWRTLVNRKLKLQPAIKQIVTREKKQL